MGCMLHVKDNLTIFLNKKKTLISTFLLVSFAIIFIILILLVMHFITNQYYIPAIQKNNSDSWVILIFLIICFLNVLIFFIGIVNMVSVAIKSIIKKEVIIINHRGILYNKFQIFSKPVFIHWNYIQDIRIFEDTRILSELLNNKSIVLKLKEEFYTDLSPIKKIIYKLNGKILKGFSFQINLKFTDGDVDEIFDKILTKCSSHMKTQNKQKRKFEKMKESFVGYFYTKKVILYSLGFLALTLICTTICIYFFTLPSSTMLTVKLPIIGRTNNKFIIECIISISSISVAIYSVYLWSLLIKLIFVNKDKKFLVIDKDGICWYNSNIFSKPMLIEWKHVKNMHVFNSKKHLFTNNYKHAIALNITQEFYNNSSFFKRIIYKLNRKFSNGCDIHINLNFSTCNADDILDKINTIFK